MQEALLVTVANLLQGMRVIICHISHALGSEISAPPTIIIIIIIFSFSLILPCQLAVREKQPNAGLGSNVRQFFPSESFCL